MSSTSRASVSAKGGAGGGGGAVKASSLAVKVDGGGKGKEIVDSGEAKKKQVAIAKKKSVVVEAKTQGKATTAGSSKTVTKTTQTTTGKAKAGKKVFSLAGQKHDPPEEREPLRIFYESLSKQIPSSEMAEFWMMEHGLLSPERAKKAYDRKQKRQHALRTGTPIKYINQERAESSKKLPVSKDGDAKAKKRVNYVDDENAKSKKAKA